MHRESLVIVVLAGVLGAPAVKAQEIPCTAGPCVRPPQPGTHFIAELNGGGSFAGGAGPAVGGVVGVGGKLRGFPLPFYLIGELAYSSAAQDGALQSGSVDFHEERSYRDLALGLRVYIPVYGPLRLFVDAMGGGSHVAALVERDNLTALSSSHWAGMGLLATGLQLRLFHHLSVGLRAKVVLAGGDALDGLREVLRIETPTRTSATAGLTWHF